VIDVDGMVREEEVLSVLDPNGGSARARFVWDLAYRRGARTLSAPSTSNIL
jgi:hypothetical protein